MVLSNTVLGKSIQSAFGSGIFPLLPTAFVLAGAASIGLFESIGHRVVKG